LNTHKALLLRLIAAKSDVGPLLSQGLLYSQISLLLGELIRDGFVSLSDGNPTLTTAGLEAIRTDERTGTPRHDGGFISPVDTKRIDKLPVDAIYLPVFRNSFF
jgi:hypothetical protein